MDEEEKMKTDGLIRYKFSNDKKYSNRLINGRVGNGKIQPIFMTS